MSKKNQAAAGGFGTASALAGRPAVPSVNLIPPYVAKRQAGRATQIKAVAVLVLVVLALAGGYVGISLWSGAAEDRLAAAEAEATRLAERRKQYAEVIQVSEELEMTKNALAAAVSYEIRWPDLIAAMFDNRPPDSRLAGFTLAGMSAGEAMASSDNVLAPARIGMVTLVIETPSLPATSAWLRSFNSIPGVEDGSYFSAVKQDGVRGEIWVVNCTAQVNLVGLVGGAVFPEDFQEWLVASRAGGEQPAEGSAE
ncbi:MAG: hypothetical protein LBD97_05730 [Bifidobacteriaceae bacterium]|jgi:hypothetical protein|nr:hypothetical protein [Bifidobacteriaceae bacterium]